MKTQNLPQKLSRALGQYVFSVKPVSSIDAVSGKYGWSYPWMNDKNIKLREELPIRDIQLIKARGTQENALKYISELGFTPAHPEYLLGFGATYPKLLSKYRNIVALDKSDTIKGGNGFAGSICIDWHDESELRLLNENKELGPSWWVPVYANHSIYGAADLDIFQEGIVRPSIAENPMSKFHIWDKEFGLKVLIDDTVELKFHRFGYYGGEYKKFFCCTSPSTHRISDNDIAHGMYLSGLSDLLMTAYWLIGRDVLFYHLGQKHFKSVLRDIVATGQENLNLGYYDDGIGIKMLFLECKVPGKEYHIHEEYIPRIYKPNRFMLVEKF